MDQYDGFVAQWAMKMSSGQVMEALSALTALAVVIWIVFMLILIVLTHIACNRCGNKNTRRKVKPKIRKRK